MSRRRTSTRPSSPCGDEHRELGFVAQYPFDIAPVTDDQPFFFRSTRWEHLRSTDPFLRGSVPVMEWSLLLLFTFVGATALIVVAVPLRALRLPLERRPGLWRFGAFFAATGLGYLALEVALLQKFGLFLGHPSYALSVVLAALLLFTGLGSLASEEIVGRLGGLRFAAYALAFVVLAQHLLILPRLPALGSLPFPLRCALVSVLVAPSASSSACSCPPCSNGSRRGPRSRALGLGHQRDLLRPRPDRERRLLDDLRDLGSSRVRTAGLPGGRLGGGGGPARAGRGRAAGGPSQRLVTSRH